MMTFTTTQAVIGGIVILVIGFVLGHYVWP